MSNRHYEKTFTGDGQHVIDPATGSSASQISISGDAGGGSVEIGFIDKAGAFIAFRDELNAIVDIQPESSIVLTHGRGVKLALSIAGTTAALFTVYRAESS